MGHLLKIIAVIITITYSLHLVNASSDLLVFSGFAVILLCLYFLLTELNNVFEKLKTKL